MKLYDDEKELFESVEKGEWSSVDNLAGEIAAAKEAAEGTENLMRGLKEK